MVFTVGSMTWFLFGIIPPAIRSSLRIANAAMSDCKTGR
jgi:hypothetical protein